MEEDQKVEVSEKELGLVIDIFKTLAKTVKTFNVYPKDNPIYQKFATELFENFNAFFESNDELSIDIEQHFLFYKSKEVFHSEERTDNIPLLLFADGLRKIDFHKGISPDEIIDFIDILRFAPKSATNDDDDIITLLWEKNIRNMSYTVVEDTVDDKLTFEEGLLQEGINLENISGTTISGISYLEPTIEPFSLELQIKPLTDDELEALKTELSLIEEKPLLSLTVELFFELLSDEKNMEVFPEMLQNLGKIIDIRMKKGDIKDAIEILRRLKEISFIYHSPEQIDLIKNVIYKAGSPENLRMLFNESSNSDDIRQYLHFFEKTSIPHMIKILGELQDRKQRKLLCEILAEIGRQDIDTISEALQDERWYLVTNIAMILGLTKEPAAIKYLEQVLRHPDLRVRRETVKALVSIRSEETKNLFLAALNDEDLTVRITALKALRRFKDPDLFQELCIKASREELRKKSFEEKKELLETLAVLGGENAFPLLSGLFKKKWLIETDEMTEIRASAAYGLGLIRTAEAISLLEKETGSKKSLLREACLKGIKESQHIGNIRRESS